MRDRKLLLHRREIDKLLGKTREKGLTLIPTKIYLKNGRIKCELALARGKKLHDKREAERTRTAEAEARAAMRRHNAVTPSEESMLVNGNRTVSAGLWRQVEADALVVRGLRGGRSGRRLRRTSWPAAGSRSYRAGSSRARRWK